MQLTTHVGVKVGLVCGKTFASLISHKFTVQGDDSVLFTEVLKILTSQQQVNLMELNLMTCVREKGVLAYMSGTQLLFKFPLEM